MAGHDQPAISAGERLALNRMGSFDWDLRDGTVELDAPALAVFDLLPGEFDGRVETLRPHLPPEEDARIDATVESALRTGLSSYGAYFQLIRRNGLRQWTHVRGRILRDDSGEPYRVIGILRDATTEPTEFTVIDPKEAGRRRLTATIQRTTEALSRALTVDDVTAVLTGAGGLERFGAQGLALALVEGDGLNLVELSGESMEVLNDLRHRRLDSSTPLAEAMVTQKARFFTSLDEVAELFPRMRPYLPRLDLRAGAFLPLIAQARTIGGLALYFREYTQFSEEDRDLCLGLAGIVAQSLQRAILFDQDREFATGLQASMLPRRIPEFSGAEIAVRYHAAWSGREVGGDWYDVIALPGGRVGLVVGDVEGHDTHAAAIMGQLRIALRAFAGEGHAPSTVLGRASRFLAELDTDRFATCTYAQVDLATGGVRAVRAGHLCPLVRHPDGTTGWATMNGGLPLGLATDFSQEEYPESRFDLVPGEALVLYTDGLVEEPGADISVGMAALGDAVRTGPVRAEALADHITDRLRRQWGAGGAGGDDVALLVLNRPVEPGAPPLPRIHQYIHQADPDGLAESRQALRQALEDWGLAALADDVELAAGELLGNVLLHTDSGAVLTLEVLPEPARRVRLWVSDRSSIRPRPRSPGEGSTSGRGLLLVDAVTTRWGVEPRGDGKAVWCEFEPPYGNRRAAS